MQLLLSIASDSSDALATSALLVMCPINHQAWLVGCRRRSPSITLLLVAEDASDSDSDSDSEAGASVKVLITQQLARFGRPEAPVAFLNYSHRLQLATVLLPELPLALVVHNSHGF